MVIGVSVVQEQKGPGHTTKTDHLGNLLTEAGTTSRFVWRRTLSSANSRVHVFEILQSSVLMRRMKGKGAGTHFKNEPEKTISFPQTWVFPCSQLFLSFSVTIWIQNNMPVRLDQEEVTAPAHHRFAQWVTACSQVQEGEAGRTTVTKQEALVAQISQAAVQCIRKIHCTGHQRN